MSDEMKNTIKLMLEAFSDCTGAPVRNLSVNTKMRTKWDTGVFTAVEFRDGSEQPAPIPTAEAGWVYGTNFELRFDVQYSKPGDSGVHTAAVIFRLHDSYGAPLFEIIVDCPQEVFDSIDVESIGLPPCQKDDNCNGRHILYSERGYKGLTLVEDLPRCRELICRLCRELTSQLWKHGYFLRPVEACPDLG